MVGVAWADLTAVGAFIVGAAFGIVVTIRLLRVAIDVVRRERRDD